MSFEIPQPYYYQPSVVQAARVGAENSSNVGLAVMEARLLSGATQKEGFQFIRRLGDGLRQVSFLDAATKDGYGAVSTRELYGWTTPHVEKALERNGYRFTGTVRELFSPQHIGTHAKEQLTRNGGSAFVNYFKSWGKAELRDVMKPLSEGRVEGLLYGAALALCAWNVGDKTVDAFSRAKAEGEGTVGATCEAGKTFVREGVIAAACWRIGGNILMAGTTLAEAALRCCPQTKGLVAFAGVIAAVPAFFTGKMVHDAIDAVVPGGQKEDPQAVEVA